MRDWQINYALDEALQTELDKLIDANDAEALGYNPDRSRTYITITKRDEQGLIAGLDGTGRHGSDWFYINAVYVRSDHRKRGLGIELIEQCAQEARAKGFAGLTLQTMDFQAAGFYRKAGFEQYAALENDFAGHTRYYFKKRIA